jgi:hypothetical protein
MEDKRGIKRECSPSIGGSPLPDDDETPPPASSGSPPPPRSPLVASSCHPCSLVFEQGNASRKILMLDPSSFIVDTSHDEELTRKLFGDLNHDILGSPGDGKIIVLDDSDDDGEAREEKTADIESTTAPAIVDDAPAEVRIGNSDDQGPDQEADGGNNSRHSAGDPYAYAPRTRCCNRRALRTPMMHYSAFSLFLLCSL